MPLKGKAPMIAAFTAVVTGVALLAGCASSAASPSATDPGGAGSMPATCTKGGPVAFAVSGRRDSPAPGLTAMMQTAVEQAVQQGSAVGVVDVDGAPRLTTPGSADTQGMNSEAAQQFEISFLDAVTSKIQDTRATSPHADVLDALNVAAGAIRSACSHGGTIFLEDSGLQDVQPLDFATRGLLTALPPDVVSFLRSEHEIPNLDGITVVLVGVGDTAPPQQPLAIGQQTHLRAIWSAIITAGGGRVETDPSPRDDPAPSDVPPVDLIPVPSLASWPGAHEPSFTLPDTGPVGFQPNKANFRDPSAARAALGILAQYLLENPAARIELTGTTARWGGDAWDETLSSQRANTVKAALISLGVGAAQVLAHGVGWRSPCYEPDGGPAGPMLESQAEHNRSVIVTILPNAVTC
jgi:OOP family OmpA-OmpF porin